MMTEAGDKPPFRDPNASTGKLFAFNRPTVIVLFYLATYFTGFSCLVGVILAYIWRGEEHEEWEGSHYAYLIRTFWLMLLALPVVVTVMLVLTTVTFGLALEEVGIAIGLLLAAFVIGLAAMLVVRCFRSLMRAQVQEAMPNPRSWLF